MALQPTDRRTVLAASGIALSTVLAGCPGNVSIELDRKEDGNGTAADDDGNETVADNGGTTTPSAEDPAAVIDAYLAAAREEDTDALADAIHEDSAIHPSNFEGTDWEFDGSDERAYEYTNPRVIDDDPSIEDVRAFEGVAFWFESGELEEALADAEVEIVGVDLPSSVDEDQPDRWVLATEDDDWTVFWFGREDDPPENPEDAFEDEIVDEDGDVVDRVEWDIDVENELADPREESFDYAKVVLTDSPGMAAEKIVIESTIADGQFAFHGRDEDEMGTGWSGSWANVQLEPEGDQIVVTAVQPDTEEIVHRVHYEP